MQWAGVVCVALCVAVCAATPLDDYVNLPDPNYAFYDTGHGFSHDGYDAYVLNMTSQQWLTPNDVSRSIWWHYLVVIIPHELHFRTQATLYITGGSNTDGYPGGSEEDVEVCSAIALADHVICAVLFQIPNQPIVFAADPEHAERSEDAMVAFTWYHFININSSDPYWLARMPMVKAGVRAMDAVTEFVQQKTSYSISEFVVAGASKRGWTTWLVGAVDQRVIAIVPIVMDALNFIPVVHHFWQNLGGWSFALSDYYALNFTRDIDLPQTAEMVAIIDPINYASRLTMPKLVIDTAGDEFFQPDDNHYWWDQMPGEKHLLFCPNAEHSLATAIPEVLQSVSAFVYGVLVSSPRPTMTWEWYNGTTYGNLTISTSTAPLKVKVWHADTLSDERRDFRLVTGENPCPTFQVDGQACFNPVISFLTEATKIDDTTYTVSFDAPEKGWRMFWMTAEFEGVTEINYLKSTQVVIIPPTFPFPPCEGNSCYGTLL